MLSLLVIAFLMRELRSLAGVLPNLTETAHSGILLLRNYLVDMTDSMPQSLRPLLQRNVNTLFSGGTALLDRGFSHVLGLAGTMIRQVPDGALNFGTAVISGYMISAKMPRIRNWILTRFSRERLLPLLNTLKQIKNVAGGWLLAQLKLTGVTFLLLLAGMLILRIPYGALWAAGICLLDTLPVLGTGAVLLPWGLILYLQGDRARAIGLVAVYTVIAVSSSVLEPKLVGRQLGLDPLVTLFALYAGYKLWGLGGMILSPLLAVTVTRLLQKNSQK
jgi:sporulation integral membrane protein YtvI